MKYLRTASERVVEVVMEMIGRVPLSGVKSLTRMPWFDGEQGSMTYLVIREAAMNLLSQDISRRVGCQVSHQVVDCWSAIVLAPPKGCGTGPGR